eukprot:4766693-Alexandrium_andersonii.AAC.1
MPWSSTARTYRACSASAPGIARSARSIGASRGPDRRPLCPGWLAWPLPICAGSPGWRPPLWTHASTTVAAPSVSPRAVPSRLG